jgi:hypothetical protein
MARAYILNHRQTRDWLCRRAQNQFPLIAICDWHTTLSSPRKLPDASQTGIYRTRR